MVRTLSPAFKPTPFRPGYLAALAGVLIAALGGFAWYELHTSRKNTLETLEHSSAALVQAMARAGENALRAEEELDQLVQEHLLGIGRGLARLQGHWALSDSLLAQVAQEQGLARIEVFDTRGYPLYSSSPQPMDRFELDWWWEELAEVYDHTALYHQVVLDAAELYAVAAPAAEGGVVLVQASAQRLHELRRAAGIGRLIREIGDNQGVVFAALQDSAGIILGSSGIGQLGTIASDPFLSGALAGTAPVSRTAQFEGREIFETAMAFAPEGKPLGLLRVGLSVEALQAERRRDQLQLVLLAGLLAVLGAAGAGVLTIRQNYALLDEAYARVQTYSSRILAQMADAVMAMDTAGRIEVLNQSAQTLFGATAAAATGRLYAEVVGATLPPVERALREGAEGQEGAQRYLVGGQERLLSLSTSLVRNSRGEVETVVVVAQDLTEMAALEADRAAANAWPPWAPWPRGWPTRCATRSTPSASSPSGWSANSSRSAISRSTRACCRWCAARWGGSTASSRASSAWPARRPWRGAPWIWKKSWNRRWPPWNPVPVPRVYTWSASTAGWEPGRWTPTNLSRRCKIC